MAHCKETNNCLHKIVKLDEDSEIAGKCYACHHEVIRRKIHHDYVWRTDDQWNAWDDEMLKRNGIDLDKQRRDAMMEAVQVLRSLLPYHNRVDLISELTRLSGELHYSMSHEE